MRSPTIERDGWRLVSAEARNQENPEDFEIPSHTKRISLEIGDAAKLLFDMQTQDGGSVIDRGVDRMWVIVKRRTAHGYEGVLDNDPGGAENLHLREGDTVRFQAEHVASIETPPRDYVVEKYGEDFFSEG